MKFFLLATVIAFSFSAQAESLKNCRLFVDGKRAQEVKAFNIDKYTSEEPEATIDGGLLDFLKTADVTKMSFSNECDNMYEIVFSNEALAKAQAGKIKTLTADATIGTADLEQPLTGVLRCRVSN